MESRTKEERQINPVERSNFLSRLIFLHTVPIFRKGEIKDKDIYKTIERCSTTKLGDRLEAEWEVEKKLKSPGLLKPILRIFRREIILLGLLVLVVNCAVLTLMPLLVGRIVRFFNQKGSTVKDGVIYCSALVGCLTFGMLMGQFIRFQIDHLTQRIKIACCTLVYRKLLKTPANQNSRGQAITLITKDVNSADMLLFCFYHWVLGFFQITIMGYIMYAQLGIPALIGLSWLIVYFPLLVVLVKYAGYLRFRAAATTDKRLRETQEVFTAARVIKMYTWEAFHIKAVEYLRKKEMAFIRMFRCFEVLGFCIGFLSTKLIFGISIISYIAFGNNLTAEKVFTVTSSLGVLHSFIQITSPLSISQGGNFMASFQRFASFLTQEEVTTNDAVIDAVTPEITLKNLTIKRNNTTIINDVSFSIKNGLSVVKGPTGSGKTSLLLSFMNEIRKTSGIIDVKGTISYASQEPWLFPGTIRQNIVFGEAYNRKRYETVIEVCNLVKDFGTFSEGDSTYLTDRGLNLSRGQKTRINLARCVYKSADIYLLDDCLSALDVQVANDVFYKCIKGLLRHKICVMATHSDTYTQYANHVLDLREGSLTSQTHRSLPITEDDIDTNNLVPFEQKVAIREKEPNGLYNCTETTKLLENDDVMKKNIYEESNEKGGVSYKVYLYYISCGGGICIFLLLLCLFIAAQCTTTGADYFISIWVNAEQRLSYLQQENLTNTTEYATLAGNSKNMLYQYAGIIVMSVLLMFISSVAFLFFTYRISLNLHRTVLSKIIYTSLQFFDTTLSGNVLNRFSRDIGISDDQLPVTILHVIQIWLVMIGMLGIVSAAKPFFLLISGMLLLILYTVRYFYLFTSRSIRRLEGSTRSPIIGHLNATVDGLTTIRANKMQAVLLQQFEQHHDLYNSVNFMNISTSCAFSFMLDVICTTYIAAVTYSIIFLRESFQAGDAGLVVTQSLRLSGAILEFCIRFWSDVENFMTSVERVMIYTKAEPENTIGPEPADWPNKGVITYKDINLKYPLTGDLVLKHISFVVNSREKLGVVGRTGAGKSSLISVLFRLYDFKGGITIDGVRTDKVGLKYLRSCISIIPQDPFLFTGTIRENLDPYNQYTDKQLWDVLDQVELKPIIDNLQVRITEGGNNYSIGQKQLVCLARAILRKNVILVLDEATANLDHNTDAAIQRTIKNNFSDCTVITIAHRILTVMKSDKILVIDQGEVGEFGSPQSLLSNENGKFYKMVKEAGLN